MDSRISRLDFPRIPPPSAVATVNIGKLEIHGSKKTYRERGFSVGDPSLETSLIILSPIRAFRISTSSKI